MTNASRESAPLALLQQNAQVVTDYLDRFLGRCAEAPPRLLESIRYSLMAGGKRLRPALVLETCRACRASVTPSALAAAGAIELIHTFSLVHDDLPAMDDDDLRRGRPTNHIVFGEAMAILAGDAMVTLAFELLAADAEVRLVPRLVTELASASGPVGMIGGQVLDIAGQNNSLSLDELRHLHARKTGALLVAACRMGAISADAEPDVLSAVTDFGRHLGLAFQITDDLLDLTATSEQLGKRTRKDAAKGKNTYPALLGVDGSRRDARSQLESALSALVPLGSAADRLRDLARFVLERSS